MTSPEIGAPLASHPDHALRPAELRMPVEVSLTIMGAGLVGLVLPGPFGAPLIVGGGLSLWPKAFRPVDHWVRRNTPRAHASGTIWLDRFRDDLQRRYPVVSQSKKPAITYLAPAHIESGSNRNGH